MNFFVFSLLFLIFAAKLCKMLGFVMSCIAKCQ